MKNNLMNALCTKRSSKTKALSRVPGGVFGSQIGTKMNQKLVLEQFLAPFGRFLDALERFLVALARFWLDLVSIWNDLNQFWQDFD